MGATSIESCVTMLDGRWILFEARDFEDKLRID